MTQREINQIADAVIKKLQDAGVVPAQPVEEFIGVKQAAEYLCITTGTLYKKISEIPHVKRGKKLLFTKKSLSEYIHR